MPILLDTHALIWLLMDSPRLTGKARQIIEDAGADVFFSSVSIMEIAIKHSLKPELMPVESRLVDTDARAAGLKSLDFSCEAAVAMGELPWIHRDPFDRMLISQAQVKGIRLLSHDDHVMSYGEVVVGF